MWPATLPRVTKDRRSVTELTWEDIVPSEPDEVMAWAYVEAVGGSRFFKKYAVLYTQPNNNTDQRTVVTIRLQGFIKYCDLRPFGTWKG